MHVSGCPSFIPPRSGRSMTVCVLLKLELQHPTLLVVEAVEYGLQQVGELRRLGGVRPGRLRRESAGTVRHGRQRHLVPQAALLPEVELRLLPDLREGDGKKE